MSEEELLAIRSRLPKVRSGDPLQLEKWRIAQALRRVRERRDGGLPQSAVMAMVREFSGKPCPECGELMARWLSGRVPSVDHIQPLSKGGGNDRSNLRVICNRCNAKKGNR